MKNQQAGTEGPMAGSRKSRSESSRTNQTERKSSMRSSKLMQLFEDELKDIYWVEKALTRAIPKMADNATSPELVDALESHLAQTKEQIGRVERVFELIYKKASAKKCEAMEGLIEEAEDIMEDCDEGSMRDAGIISAAQKIEHYEIASYGTLRQFAETLRLREVVDILQTTLDEEKSANDKLTEVATRAVNIEAAQENA
jgi:ferritin-like metal-binding protein YciE